MQPSARRPAPDERGQVLPWIVVMFVILLGMAGMAIDLGNAYRVHQQLQATAAAAAAAGADNLPSTSNAVTAAASYSAATGGKNSIRGAGPVTESAYTDCSTDTVHCNGANTVHVTETASVPTTFLRLFGISTINQTVRAQACSPCGGAPLDVMIVLDRTGSMDDARYNGKLTKAKDGIEAFMSTMDPAIDEVGLVIFPPATSSTAECSDPDNNPPDWNYGDSSPEYTVVPLNNTYATSLGNLNSSSDFMQTLNCVKAGGSTAYAAALDAAKAELDAHGRTNTQKVVVILSDGAADAGPTYLATSNVYRTQPCTTAIAEATAIKAAKVLVYSIAYDTNGLPSNGACFMDKNTKNPYDNSTNGYDDIPEKATFDKRGNPTATVFANATLQAIASPGSGYFYNQPDASALTGIFNAISADIAQGTSRING